MKAELPPGVELSAWCSPKVREFIVELCALCDRYNLTLTNNCGPDLVIEDRRPGGRALAVRDIDDDTEMGQRLLQEWKPSSEQEKQG